RDPTQTEYVVHLLVKGDGQGSSAPADTAAAGAHRRVATAPAAAAPGQPQPQPQPQQAPLNIALEQVRQQQEQIHHVMVQQQQQMAQQRAQMGLPPHVAGMPQMPMPPNFSFQQGPIPGYGFPHAVAQGQQQRAAMGLHGVGPPGARPVPQQDGAGTTSGGDGQPALTSIPAGQPDDHQRQGPSGLPPGLQHPHFQPGAPRPISGQGFHFEGIGPNGQRVHIHQQTLQIPGMPANQPHFAMPGQHLGMPGMMPQIPGFNVQQPLPQLFPPQLQQQQPTGPSALDRARENVAEMRRMLDEMHEASVATEDQRSRIRRLRERVQGVSDYIDPFQMNDITGRRSAPQQAGTTAHGQGRGLDHSTAAGPQLHSLPQMPSLPPLGLAGRTAFGNPTMQIQQPHPLAAAGPTCFLLSGPQGPQALLFSPQHGTYTGALTQPGNATRPISTPTAPQSAPQQQQEGVQQALAQLVQTAAAGPQAPNAAAAAPAPNAQQPALPVQNGAGAAAAADPNAPVQALLNHVWLLFRVLIFAYFIMGSNLGWKRPMALIAIGMGFWMVRAGLFGEGGVARRWWEGVVRVGPAPARAPAAEGPDAFGGRQQAMPSPAEVARRLIDERDAGRRQAWREFVRPVERAVALFVASLWPGIGEAHVRARREEEERRQNEAEVAGRRAEEEATARTQGEGGAKESGDVEVTAGRAEPGAAAGAGSGEDSAGAAVVADEEVAGRVTPAANTQAGTA
ncbi:hypothetical protein LTR53_016618, partial [Teratosphaeriaceae sp. CCFEE 6253]